jgi:hypothetical protein
MASEVTETVTSNGKADELGKIYVNCKHWTVLAYYISNNLPPPTNWETDQWCLAQIHLFL